MVFILNFHGIGEAQRAYEDGEQPYWIDEARFHQCLDMVQGSSQDVILTFDDGNASDHNIAWPELKKRGLKAIYFVLAGKLGQAGYLTQNQVRALNANPLVQIGTHGMDHQAWPGLDNDELQREIGESISILGDICEKQITAAGLPFGRYDRRVMERLRARKITQIYSSDGTAKLTDRSPIPRFSVRSDTDMAALAAMISSPPAFMKRAKNEVRAWIKSLR